MWQHLLFGIDPAQLIDTTVTRADTAANGTQLNFPLQGFVPRNEAWIIHGMNLFQDGGATTARKLRITIAGPVVNEVVDLEQAIVPAPDQLILRRPLLIPPDFNIVTLRNGFDVNSTLAYLIWWQRVSLPAKRSLDKTRSPSPRRLDEIFMLTEG